MECTRTLGHPGAQVLNVVCLLSPSVLGIPFRDYVLVPDNTDL